MTGKCVTIHLVYCDRDKCWLGKNVSEYKKLYVDRRLGRLGEECVTIQPLCRDMRKSGSWDFVSQYTSCIVTKREHEIGLVSRHRAATRPTKPRHRLGAAPATRPPTLRHGQGPGPRHGRSDHETAPAREHLGCVCTLCT